MNKNKYIVKNELCFRIIKILDIFYIGSLSAIIALISANFVDKCYGKFDENKWNEYKKEKGVVKFYMNLIFHVIFVASMTAIILYILRNILTLIPSPFDSICGFEHLRVKELVSIGSLLYILFILFFHYQLDFFNYVKKNI